MAEGEKSGYHSGKNIERKAPRLVSIDAHISLPNRDPRTDEPSGIAFTLKKRLAG